MSNDQNGGCVGIFVVSCLVAVFWTTCGNKKEKIAPSIESPSSKRVIITCSHKFVSANSLNVRNAPDGEIIDKLHFNDRICVQPPDYYGWSQIGSSNQNSGKWVHNDFLRPENGRKRIPVPDAGSANYYFVSQSGSWPRITITTQRLGLSGQSFARREIDCENGKFRYLADVENFKQINDGTPGSWGDLSPGSISYHISIYACDRALQ